VSLAFGFIEQEFSAVFNKGMFGLKQKETNTKVSPSSYMA